MKALFASVVLSAVFLSPALACNGGGNCENAPAHLKAAPGPLIGAGLPGAGVVLAYGAYWLVRRRSKRAL
jgi:hypothetical protein